MNELNFEIWKKRKITTKRSGILKEEPSLKVFYLNLISRFVIYALTYFY